jgi:dihydropteroate synthase
MIKYYTRACNFYYGSFSKKLVKTKQALPLCGNKEISFDNVEIFSKNKNKITSKIIDIKKIDFLPKLSKENFLTKKIIF